MYFKTRYKMNISIRTIFNIIHSNNIFRWLIRNKKILSILSFIFIIAIPTAWVYIDHIIYPPASKEDIEEMKKLIEKKFPGSDIKINCEKFRTPVHENGAVFIDKCILMSLPLTYNKNSIGLVVHFRSDWQKSKDDLHYIFSIYDKSNEISAFEENNTIKMKVSSDGIEHILTLPLKEVNWKDGSYSNEWNKIGIIYNGKDKQILLDVNDVRKFTYIDADIYLSNITFFLGASYDSKYFAEGWFDDYRIFDPTISNGSFTSKIVDAKSESGAGEVWGGIMFDGTIPVGTGVDIYINSTDDNIEWSGWQLIKMNASTGIAYEIPSVYQKCYGQFRLILRTDDTLFLTPLISSVNFIKGSR